jgi:N-acetylglucosamine malate deacetylase 1
MGDVKILNESVKKPDEISNEKLVVLVVAAHPDDEVLGIGGTLAKHKEAGHEVHICIATKPTVPPWTEEYVQKKKQCAANVDKLLDVDSRTELGFPTVKLNTLAHGELNAAVSNVVNKINPDIIYTHYWGDVNKDHVLVFDAVNVATRPQNEKKIKVYCFDTVSETEWGVIGFKPTKYIQLERSHVDKKIKAFLCYDTEVKEYPHPRSAKGLEIQAQKYGMDICVEYAEGLVVFRDYGI